VAGFSGWLESAWVDDAVFALRPDYRAVLLLCEGLRPGPSDDVSEKLLTQAEDAAAALLGEGKPEELGHLAAWREAFRAFGAKPQRTRNSAEALMRRVGTGLPRVDRLTDAYNAVSLTHAVPLGGEDAAHYQGPLRLVRAVGDEAFETTAGGEAAVEHPEPGEVVWRDDAGVTCRRWNWRQCSRTRLTEDTTTGIFIVDTLAPLSEDGVSAVADALVEALRATSPELAVTRRTLAR
jgi:DNA/RNA-binding domain of Phe-tRNA-synthetase-like protein